MNFVSRPEGECTNTTFYEAIGWSLGRETLFFINNPFLNLVYHRDIADQMNQENKIFPEKLTDVGYDFKFNSVDDAIDDCVLWETHMALYLLYLQKQNARKLFLLPNF